MKIGVWVGESLNKNSGGGFTYFNTLIAGIDGFSFSPGMDVVFVSKDNLTGFDKPFINVKAYQRELSIITKVFRKSLKLVSATIFRKWINFLDQKEKKIKDNSVSSYLESQGVKIIFYPLPASAVIEGIPYILNNWDLGHYSSYAFPEIAADNGFYKRNDWYVKVMPSALMVFCESEAGKKEIVQYLNFNPDKIRVLPIFSSNAFLNMEVPQNEQMSFLTDLGLEPQKFFFYPAQFWAHKNHYNLIRVFQKFHLEHPGHKLLLCGSDKGNLSYIKNYAASLGIGQSVIFSGFIEDNVLYSLYKNAVALVMPTFFGPTNIPPIEALFLGCPAIISDLEGHREIMNNGALYFNPMDDDSILKSMKAVMDDTARMQMLKDQKEQSKITNHTIERALTKLENHFNEAMNIRNCWE